MARVFVGSARRIGLVLAVLALGCEEADTVVEDGGPRVGDGAASAAIARDASADASSPRASEGSEAIDMDAGELPDSAAAADATADAADASHDDGATEADEPRCEIGVADEATGHEFVTLVPDQPIRLTGGAQTSLLAVVALRVTAPPIPSDIVVVLRSNATGREERTEIDGETDFDCDDAPWCALVPIYVTTSDLVDDPFDLDDLKVTVEATVRDASSDAGPPFCVAELKGRLYRF